MAAREQRDRSRAHRRGLRLAAVDAQMKRTEPRPGRASGETEVIEPIGFVALEAHGEDFAFPRAGGGFVALELRDDDAEGIGPFHARGRDTLPGEEEAHEVARRDGL